MLISDYRELCPVPLPYFGRQLYMHTFNLEHPQMPVGFEDYLAPVVLLCEKAGVLGFKGVAHMTVDEKIVEAGMSQRRPRPHVDGCFIPAQMEWGHNPTWAHHCNNVGEKIGRMPVIVAASVPGCRAWRGSFDAVPASDGDLSFLKLNEGEVLEEDMGYLLSADCVHESMIMTATVARTFLRIALPVTFQF